MNSNLLLLSCHLLLCKTSHASLSISSKERPVNPGEAPYHIALYYLDKYLCGGALITVSYTQAIITSGVCVTQISPSEKLLYSEHLQVKAGKISLNAMEEQTNNVQHRNVANILRHEKWRRDPVPYNDIAIILLDKNFDLNIYVQPLHLQMTRESYKPTGRLIISGFGPHLLKSYSALLQIASISVVSNDICNEVYRHACIRRNISEESFCLGIPRHSEYQAVCIADEGSPAVDIISETLYLVGIFSFGQPYCGKVYQPSVYTDLSYYSSWISEIVTKSQTIHKIVKRSPVVKYRMKYRNPRNNLRKPKRKSPVKHRNHATTNFFRGPSLPFKEDFSYPSVALSRLVRIGGGRDATAGEVPYQALILDNGYYLCSGAIVNTPSNKQLILTSAECLSRGGISNPEELLPVKRFTVKAGVLDHTKSECYEQSRTVVETFRYDDYNHTTFSTNIGFMLLNEPFSINLFVKPISMPPEQDLKVAANTILKVTGWGHKTADQDAQTEILQILEIPAIANEDCIKRLNASLVFKYTFCTYDGTKGACFNDEGTIAAAEDPKSGAVYLAGIFSYARRKCGTNVPQIFTSVSHFMGWIDDRVCSIDGCKP